MPYALTIYPTGESGYRAVSGPAELHEGEIYVVDLPSPTTADVAASLSSAVQLWLDQTARTNGYDSLASCISYRGSSITQWDADASRAMAWRDAVWTAAFQWQQSAAASASTIVPTAAQVIAQLPQPAAFGWVAHSPGASG